ncbi:putative QueD like protein [Anopheles sinensis]|uniref:Putative QueD like protein n=1 Tax=Anopheles sinensis TaxID=74873 RepID=A0A084VST0_ANOSI|nr:putative QueD like protein [Anopheles sinensis]
MSNDEREPSPFCRYAGMGTQVCSAQWPFPETPVGFNRMAVNHAEISPVNDCPAVVIGDQGIGNKGRIQFVQKLGGTFLFVLGDGPYRGVVKTMAQDICERRWKSVTSVGYGRTEKL